MSAVESIAPQPKRTEQIRAEVQSFTQEHRRALQITGLVAIAGVTGAVGGVLVAKSIVAGKGITAAHLTLAAKGATSAKAGATALPALLTPQTANAAVATSASAPGANSLAQLASLFNSSATNGVALVDKATALWNTVSTNVLPLAAGVVGGGAAGVGVTQRRVRKVEEQLATQLAQTADLQAETAQLHHALSNTEAQLQTVQTGLAERGSSTLGTVGAPIVSEPDRLERIHGIGRVFSQRLNEAGIYTIADLAAQSPEKLEAIIDKTRAGAMFEPENWIAEAQAIVRGATGNQ